MALITKFAPLRAVIPAIGGSVVATTAMYTWFRRTWPSAPTYSTEWNQASEDKLYHKVWCSFRLFLKEKHVLELIRGTLYVGLIYTLLK